MRRYPIFNFFVLAVAGWLAMSGDAAAQMGPGPIVRAIEIEYVGPPSVTRERVLANLATRVGEPYSERAAEQDIRSLYATGAVSNVRLFAEPFEDGVKVTVLLQGRAAIEEIIIEGAEQIAANRVRREIGSKVGDILSEERLEDDRQKILKLYEDRNFAEVSVEYRVQEIGNTNRVRVIFSIMEGPKMVVKRITFIGNDAVLAKDLRGAMKTKTHNILSFFNKSGRLLPAQIEEDQIAIRSLYQNRGFADALVTDYQVQPLSERDGVEITITIQEGSQYRVNQLVLDGVNIVPPDELKQRLTMVEGSLYTPKGMADDLRAMRDFYGARGYVDLMAMPEVNPAGPGQVDLTYRVDEGIQSYVNLINIQGNTRTKDRVIRRELALKPGEVFDSTRVDLSRNRLDNLNYFSRVEMVPQDTIVPGRKDLNVIVEEKRTGSFNFGAGFSTIDSLVGFAELQQSNFDVLNWPRFTGAGQRFRVRGQYGIRRRDFVISLTEPWFLGYKLSVGVEGYYRDAAFLSQVYDQSNYGVAFQARKQLFGPLSARAEYRIEGVRIFNVDTSDAGIEIQEAAGTYTKSAVTGALSWDTRDNLFLTRRGELVEFTSFISGGGLGGDVNDYGLELSAAKFISLPLDLIFLVRGQLAVVDGYDNSQVPIFDRLYLGGANNMRGFDFREVGPKDEFGNPIGGNSLGYVTLELTFPVISRVRGAIFTDWGFVNQSAYDFGTANANGDIGFGVRLDLPIGPIRVDYGIPVMADQWNNSSGKFNINVGYQF